MQDFGMDMVCSGAPLSVGIAIGTFGNGSGTGIMICHLSIGPFKNARFFLYFPVIDFVFIYYISFVL